ncbi:peptidoglycan-binding domain-containing protein [Rhodococcoides fascians]|uniref:peptidoglycan-binding domain-containing protein n=1 Tax=Rhodococcoides fascians TaxID=1828 RepID=UPI00068A654B|nr:peptidoglycan-binding domain-containing protein [Rhodococcus fascians]
MGIQRSRLNQLDTFGNRKSGLAYEYGGDGDGPYGGPSGDCSWAVAAAAAILQGQSPARRYGSTETWNNPGAKTGPLGTVHGRGPDDAVLRLGFMHGGGGVNSHVACTINYGGGRLVNFESRGMPGGVIYGSVIRGGKKYYARAWNDRLFHDFWHVPGPIIEDTNGAPPPPIPSSGGIPFIQLGSVGEEVRKVQARLNRDYPAYSKLTVDGEFGPATLKVVLEFQRRAGLEVDGIVGPATWKRLGL